ncbi:MAG: pyruvate dehydrogenase (acetyl-transferring), homodimeric type [Planctomycetia bacterium]|nr:MAG: pyruvate dehydrogenase (acetyl-transferring), homodimeric type [Planctomycetia bacterium]
MLQPNLPHGDFDPRETQDWLDSISAVVGESGPMRAEFLLSRLHDWSDRHGVGVPLAANTPYVNSIPRSQQPAYPGDRAIERRIKSFVRWNAMAMVVRANKAHEGIGGHISTFASSATILEVGFNHFFRGKTDDQPIGDQIFFQGHGSPGIYARAYLAGRIDENHLLKFRREVGGGGLSSYPHPWLMPEFWEFPTVSMGLGPITSIYQARFNRYLHDRGLADTSGSRVWAFLGDGEMDEPESLGAITLASRERLDNLTWVVNCNLQRLDGPVRGNGSIIQELEAAFRGAGWNVVKVIWGNDWDPLFDADADGMLIKRMGECVDGEYQRFSTADGAYVRKNFFGKYPQTAALVEHLSDAQIESLRLGGHDPEKVYAAMHRATTTVGRPTVILCRTIKGYGLGEAGEGKNITHQQKKLNEEELRQFRDRFDIPVRDADIAEAPFCRFAEGSPEFEYLMQRRRSLGGFVPNRRVRVGAMAPSAPDMFDEFRSGSEGKEASTTMAFMRMLGRMLRDKEIGKLIVPIVPDEARTFGMEALFRTYGIYAHAGQLYEPVDAHLLLKYEERKNGQILEEGITEAGSMASFTAAGTAYATHALPTIPFFIYYSMFGFQRIGDSIWAAADMRARGFLLGGTAGRTTLNGEGLQHQDGHSPLHAATVPNCVTYDPAWAYELATIIEDGIERMYRRGDNVFYYITLYNEQYEMPAMPASENFREGILRGMYKFRAAEKPGKLPRVHLFGSGPLLRAALRAQEILREKFEVAADVWSVTSYNELYRDALRCDRHNRLNPEQPPQIPFVFRCLADEPWPVVATSDYLKSMAHRIAPWTPKGLTALGTDGFGRSDTRESLRRHFEVDAEHTAYAALYELSRSGQYDKKKLGAALKTLGLKADAPDPAYA